MGTEDQAAIDQGNPTIPPTETTPTPPPSGEGDPDPSSSTEPETPEGIQKRFGEITRKRREAERKAAELEMQVATLQAAVEEAKKNPPKLPTLDPENYANEKEYLEAVAEQTRQQIRDEETLNRKKEAENIRIRGIQTLFDAAREKFDDWDEVARNPQLPVTPSMFEAAMGDKLGDILYFLGKNPAEAKRIASLPPIGQMKAIGILETELSKGTHKKTISGAPAPVPKVGSGSSDIPEKDESKMSRAELHAKWERERRAKLGLK